jgi:hypothetical protein
LPDGTLPGWLAEIRREAQRMTAAERRNQRRVAAGQREPPRRPGPGRPRNYGVTFVPLSEIA